MKYRVSGQYMLHEIEVWINRSASRGKPWHGEAYPDRCINHRKTWDAFSNNNWKHLVIYGNGTRRRSIDGDIFESRKTEL